MGRNKVVVIGIDGATFDIIRPMVDRGEFFPITSFMEEGKYGVFYSSTEGLPEWEDRGITHEGENMIKEQLKQLGYI